MDPTQYFDQRVRELTEMKAAGKHRHLYPHKFHAALSIPHFQFEYAQQSIANGQRLEREVSVAGRVHNKRSSGSSLYFYDLQGQGERVQVVADRKSDRSKRRCITSQCLTRPLPAHCGHTRQHNDCLSLDASHCSPRMASYRSDKDDFSIHEHIKRGTQQSADPTQHTAPTRASLAACR